MSISKWAGRLHLGQLIILWIAFGLVAFGGFVGTELVIKWRSVRYDERLRSDFDEWRRCRDESLRRYPAGILADSLATLEAEISTPFEQSNPFVGNERRSRAQFERSQAASRAALESLRAREAARLPELRTIGDSVREAREDCLGTQRRAIGDPPSRTTIRALYLLFVASLVVVALTTTWFWFGARRSNVQEL